MTRSEDPRVTLMTRILQGWSDDGRGHMLCITDRLYTAGCEQPFKIVAATALASAMPLLIDTPR
jgi:hypothetical protein